MSSRKVFLDNAATSNPKPATVQQAMMDNLAHIGASPGRGGYSLSLEAGRIVLEAREAVCQLVNAPSEDQVIFTPNVTYALNLALQGLLRPFDHVVTTSMEHNSVIRPLRALEEKRQLKITIVPCDSKGRLDPQQIKAALRPNTRLIVLTHASNVSGTVMPLADIAAIARETGVFLLVDTAQTAGVLEIDFQKLNLDALAFTGHKSLYGPPGTGGLVVSKRLAEEMEPLVFGGTGSKSDDEHQPHFLPDKFESGTANT
ncbi:MAG: aminotransferase class V-fold PLP-dependent enzyme, partial [Firmicutes bacterium]|nr:aminotransferase class V-fold PLP-dependent enzyme [Bacillota bacterium]